MTDPTFTFTLADGAEAAAFDALGQLTPRYELSGNGSQAVRRTWLDTFDWRLHRAGLVLEHVQASRQSTLRLTTASGEHLTSPADAVRWPSAVEHLPDTPLRERLLRVAGIRALVPVVKGRSAVQHVQVLNDDAKTVARVVVDQPALPGRSAAPQRALLSVIGLRGYGREAGQVARGLEGVPGVEPTTDSVYALALAAAGIRPEDYSSKVDVELDPSMPAALAVATVLQTFLAVLEANVPGAVADVDTEFLHDLRVAVRRTRSVLKLTGDTLPDGLADQFAIGFKWLGDMTTPTRDLDVFLLGFRDMAAGLKAAHPEDLDPLHTHLARRRHAAQKRLARTLRSRRFEQLLSDWRAALEAVVGMHGDAASAHLISAKELAEQRVDHAYRRVVKRGSTITPDSPAEQLHTLRKRCKELRYLLEIFASLHAPEAHRQIVRELKDLQECLGDFQDSEVQREAIGRFAAEMTAEGSVPAVTILAMGELTAQLEAEQRAAREDYAGRFERFMRRKNRQAVAHLTEATVP